MSLFRQVYQSTFAVDIRVNFLEGCKDPEAAFDLQAFFAKLPEVQVVGQPFAEAKLVLNLSYVRSKNGGKQNSSSSRHSSPSSSPSSLSSSQSPSSSSRSPTTSHLYVDDKHVRDSDSPTNQEAANQHEEGVRVRRASGLSESSSVASYLASPTLSSTQQSADEPASQPGTSANRREARPLTNPVKLDNIVAERVRTLLRKNPKGINMTALKPAYLAAHGIRSQRDVSCVFACFCGYLLVCVCVSLLVCCGVSFLSLFRVTSVSRRVCECECVNLPVSACVCMCSTNPRLSLCSCVCVYVCLCVCLCVCRVFAKAPHMPMPIAPQKLPI